MRQAMNVEEYITLQKKIYDNSEVLFKKDRGNGKLITDILNSVSDKDVHGRLVKAITGTDRTIFTKNDMIQKVVLNKVLLTHVLKLKATSEHNLTSLISLLSYTLEVKEWKSVIKLHVIPALIKLKLI